MLLSLAFDRVVIMKVNCEKSRLEIISSFSSKKDW
jgi:hypothetical protein